MASAGTENLEIPEDATLIDEWFSSTIQEHGKRRETLEPALLYAEDHMTVLVVSQKEQKKNYFKKIADAVNSVPAGNNQRTIIWIQDGTYEENIIIDRSKPFVTFYGSPDAMPIISSNRTAAKCGTWNSATVIVEADYFTMANVIVRNTAPYAGRAEGAQAVAFRASGDKAAFYNCSFTGLQDTLCDDRGQHFFKDCYIEGTVDFIFGAGISVYLRNKICEVGDHYGSVITAQGRDELTDENGYSFVHCNVCGTEYAEGRKETFLGRTWRRRPQVVFSYSSMSPVVNPLGWSAGSQIDHSQLLFGEYKCCGTGADVSRREKYTSILNHESAKPFLTLDFIRASIWLLPPPYLPPSYELPTPRL